MRNRLPVPLPAVTALLAAGGLAAQQTWIVAPTGGHYSVLQTAVNSVAPGDTLLLRGGGTHGTVIVDRSLHVVGELPRSSVGMLSLHSGIDVAISGFDLGALRGTGCSLAAEDVVCEDTVLNTATASFMRCTLDGSRTTGGGVALALGGNAVFDGCTLVGGSGTTIFVGPTCLPILATPALRVTAGCSVDVTGCALTGAGPLARFCLQSPGSSGLAVSAGAAVRVRRSTIAGGGPGVAAVEGGGTVLYEAVTFAPPFAGGAAAVLPSASSAGAAPGGTMSVRLAGEPMAPVLLAAGIGQRAPVPSPFGSLWLDPSDLVVVAIGLLDATGSLTWSLPLPVSLRRGPVVTFQGLMQPSTAPIVLSSPSVAHVL